MKKENNSRGKNAGKREPAPRTVQVANLEIFRRLQAELQTTRQDLCTTNEELKASNEELQTSNEELMSNNEELRSANESLEASERKLQSLNEELRLINNDIANLLNGTDIATVFLDTDFRIRRFTPTANTLFNLLANNVGRPIGDLTRQFSDDNLLSDARNVLRDLMRRDKEVRTAADRWLLRRITPYRMQENRIGGVALTFVDITDRKKSEQALADREERLRRMMENAHVGIAFGDSQGRILQANRTMLELVGWSENDLQAGRLNCAALCRPEDGEQDRKAMAQLATFGRAGPAEKTLIRADGAQIPVLISAFRLEANADENVTFVVDLTAQKRAEKDLRDREQRLQAILDTVTDAVITIDHRGIMQSVNAGAERMFGYSAGEMTGQNVKMLMASPHQEAHDGYIARYLSSGEKHIIGISRETQAKRKGGTVFPVDLAVSEIENLQLFVGVHRDLTRRKELEQEVLEIANLEQVRIGQELHDDVGQHLTGLVMLVEALAQQLKEEGSAHCDLAEKVAARLGEARGHLRTLSSGLVSSEVVAAGLPDALENLAARLHEVGNVTCTIDIPDAIALADAATATHLFRIAQEAINNAVRHSQATHVVLSLRSDGVNVVLSIRDDGVGLPATAHASRGLGIRLMRNRASLIGGRLSIGPGENGGTLVACTLPLQR